MNNEQPFVVTCPDGQIIYCNRAFCDLTGFSEEELRDKRCNLVPEEKNWSVSESLEKKAGKDIIRKDGSSLQVELYWQPIYDREGNIHYYNIFVNKAGEGRKERHPQPPWAYFTLMGHLPSIVYRCLNDRYWTMKRIIGSCYELTGYQPEDLIDNKILTWNDLIHPDDRERVWDVAKVAIANKRPFQQEYRIITSDGTEKWVWEQCRGLAMYKGNETIVGFITDVTERKIAEEQIKASLADQNRLINEVNDLTNEAVTNLLNLQLMLKESGCQQAGNDLGKSIKTIMRIQSRLYSSKAKDEIDFYGYTQLAQDVEFIFDGRQYLYLK